MKETFRDPFLPHILLLGFFMRILIATALPHLNADGFFYIHAGNLYASGDWGAALADHYLHPFYPILVGYFSLIIPSGWFVGASLSIVFAIGANAAMYGIAHEGWGRWPARCTAFLYAIHPIFGDMESRVLTEGLYHFLAFGAVLVMIIGVRRGCWKHGLLAGALLGGAYLTRAEGIILIGITMGVGGLFFLHPKYRAAWKCLAPALGVVLLCAAPYLFWLKSHFNRWVPSPRGAVMRVVDDATKEALKLETPEPLAVRMIRTTGSVLYNTQKAVYVTPLILIAVGLLFFRKGILGGSPGVYLLLLFTAHIAALLLYGALFGGYVGKRYVSFAAAMAVPWAGWGLCQSLTWLCTVRNGPILAGCLALGTFMSQSLRSIDFHRPERRVVLEASLWLRDNGGRGTTIIATRDAIAYHTEADFINLRNRSDWVESQIIREASFMVVEETDMQRWTDKNRSFIQNAKHFRVIKRFGQPGEGIVIYKVLP